MAAQRKAAAPLPESYRSGTRTASRPAAPPSKKRKMDPGEQKYYAVRAGKKPGVYTRWVDCQLQISGFKGAQFKSFSSFEDASAWAAGRDISTAEPTRFYGVARGKTPGVYTDWTVCQQQIVGFKGPKYKRFETLREAEQFVRTWNNPATQPLSAQPKDDGDDDDDDDEEEEDDDDAEELDTVEDDFLGLGGGPAKKLKTMQGSSTSGVCIIYADGSSLSNGMLGARAGAGVYFGPGDPRNVSERLKGDVQTNQRGELTAILRALEMAGNTQAVEIRTDSRYSIQCTTEWYIGWDKNGWRTRTGDDVKNSDLIKAIRARMDARDALGTHTHLQWVKGHASDLGNIAADQLAREGAAKPF